MQEVDYIFKVLIIGNSSVGKSNILLRFSDNIFHDTFLPTIGVDFKIKTLNINDKTIKLNIWDTAGQERFKNITSTYYKGSQGVMLVYDVTDPESFKSIEMWLGEVSKHAGPNAVKLLIGNKCDMEEDRKVSKAQGEAYAREKGFKFLETSAKNKINIDESFMTLAKEIYAAWPETDKKTADVKITRQEKKQSGCC